MRLYRDLLILLFVFLNLNAAFAQQGKLSGSLLDENEEAVPFANVAVLSLPDSAIVTGTTSDFNGQYTIVSPDSGTYVLRASAVGYATVFSPPFQVNGRDFSRSFAALHLPQSTQLLEEVAVEAMRPRVVMEADKMVVSVEGSALASGNSAFNVLAKSPGVWVDEKGELHLNGQAGVKVLIDGRLTYLSGKELQSLLESMPAENIQNIEIITNPSAKYDAEGTAGVLNINLKQNTLQGMNGSVYGSYFYNSRHTGSLGANLNYKKGKWNSFLNLDYQQRNTRREMYIARVFDAASLEQDGLDIRTYTTPSLRLGTDFQLNENHSVGVIASLSAKEAQVDWQTETDISELGADQKIDAQNLRDESFTNANFNLHYTGKLDSLGTELSADLNYVQLDRNIEGGFINHYRVVGNTPWREDFAVDNRSIFDIYSAQLDLSLPLPALEGKLEMGAKASHVVSDSELAFYEGQSEENVLIPERSNHFIYNESIFAGYASLHTRLSNRLSLQLGLRAEQTKGEGYSVTLDKTSPRSYLNLFPSVFLKHTISDNYQISYSYGRRIRRPEYHRLNPFFFYLDPYTSVFGNPHMKPQYTHSVGIVQTFMQTFNLSLNYDYTDQYFTEISAQDNESKQTLITFENLEYFRNIGIMLNAPVQILPKWSVNNTVSLAHERFRVRLEGQAKNKEQLYFRAQSTHLIKLPKDIGLEVNAAYDGPGVSGTFSIEARGYVDVGLKKSFMNDQLDASLSVTDILRTARIKGYIDLGKYQSRLDQYLYNRGLRLSLRYTFSKGERFQNQSRKVQFEELQRAGG